jgi:predicted oxidoreductase (fatty acid repression mutant protein)
VDPVLSKRVAVVRDTHEKKRDQLLDQLRTIQTAQNVMSREKKIQKRKEHMYVILYPG